MFQIIEMNKQTGAVSVLRRFEKLDDAKDYWRQVAFENIDHAHLWHKLERAEAFDEKG